MWLRQKTQSAMGRVQATTTRTQTAKASVGALTPRTQTAKSRIKASRIKTQDALARIKALAAPTQTAKARIQKDGVTKTQTSKARLASPVPKTQGAKGRVRASATRTQAAKALIGTPNLAVRAAAAPAMSVQYGTFALDESNGIVISSDYTSKDDSVLGEWRCQFHVRLKDEVGNEDADNLRFKALLDAVETNLKIPRQHLLVKFGTRIVRDWDFTQATQTAFLISPELTLLRENIRHATYEFRVRCQFPGNVPSNFFRRESMTQKSTSLRQNRVCTITATWTSSPTKTARANYEENGDTFFDAYLPSAGTDQHGNAGAWVRADEAPVSTNDENSLCTATRIYWECFAARRDSSTKSIDTIGNRREFRADSTWVSRGGFTALQNYTSGGDAFYGKLLLTEGTVNDGYWVLVDEDPTYNDQNGILTVTRTYHEVVKGLREYTVRVTTDAAGLRRLAIRGTYYRTSLDAYVNYANGIQDLVRGVLAAQTPAVTRYETRSIPKVESYDTTGKRYFFEWNILEIAYPQGPGAADHPDITINTLDIEGTIPKDPQSFPTGTTVTRLQMIRARFAATVDYTKNQDPASLWGAGGVRAYVINAVVTKLGGSPTVDVIDEKVGAGLQGNTLVGTLLLVVTGGSLLSMRVSQTLTLVPGRDFVPRADGTALSAYPFRAPPEKILKREAIYEFVVSNAAEPNPFTSQVSGYGMVDTGKTGETSYNEQNAAGTLALDTGWFIDRRAPVPYSKMVIPTTRGAAFQTVLVIITETWRKLDALEPGVAIP